MKKYLIGGLVVCSLLGIGYLSLVLVVDSKSKDVDNFNTPNIEWEGTENIDMSDSKSEVISVIKPKKCSVLDFSSAEKFLGSYAYLFKDENNNILKESLYSDFNRCVMDYYTLGDVVVICYPDGGSFERVIIRGKDVSNKVEELLGDVEADVSYESNSTIISNID